MKIIQTNANFFLTGLLQLFIIYIYIFIYIFILADLSHRNVSSNIVHETQQKEADRIEDKICRVL